MPFLAIDNLQTMKLIAAIEKVYRQIPCQEKTLKLAQVAATNFNAIGASIL